ncbi:predicted protein [Botrytis cinerea T4]|uniref:Uncharacterized protein n=1 Tax=Botryotinia fuckeliana (strain T4) TaxID=999810 RepID=G2XQM2_BOTF4|nr:predicted protein [Botrytis cinerea T4]
MASVIIITSSRVPQILDEKMTDIHSQGMVFDLPHASLFHSRSSSFHDDDDDDVSTPST